MKCYPPPPKQNKKRQKKTHYIQNIQCFPEFSISEASSDNLVALLPISWPQACVYLHPFNIEHNNLNNGTTNCNLKLSDYLAIMTSGKESAFTNKFTLDDLLQHRTMTQTWLMYISGGKQKIKSDMAMHYKPLWWKIAPNNKGIKLSQWKSLTARKMFFVIR